MISETNIFVRKLSLLRLLLLVVSYKLKGFQQVKDLLPEGDTKKPQSNHKGPKLSIKAASYLSSDFR